MKRRASSYLDAGSDEGDAPAKRARPTDEGSASASGSPVPFWATGADDASSSSDESEGVLGGLAAAAAQRQAPAAGDVLDTQDTSLGGFDALASLGTTDANAPAMSQQASGLFGQPSFQSDADPRDASASAGRETPTPPSTTPVPPAPTAEPFTHFKCQSIKKFKLDRAISEGGYGVVSKGRCRKTGRAVALKKIKFGDGQGRADDGVHISALREITTLLSISHANIVNIYEAVIGNAPDELYLVMEYIDYDVRKLITTLGFKFTLPQVKCLMRQLLSAVGYLHNRWIIHRDLKTNNLLYGSNGVLKLCDFGMARLSGEPLRSYTPLQWVLTLPFRPPEGLLGARKYDELTDMWGVGCVFAELLTCTPLFNPGASHPEVDMLDQIFALCGIPSHDEWPDLEPLLRKDPDPFVARVGEQRQGLNITGYKLKRGRQATLRDRFARHLPTDSGMNLLESLLAVNPAHRMNATDAFNDAFFEEHPAACSPCNMPQGFKK